MSPHRSECLGLNPQAGPFCVELQFACDCPSSLGILSSHSLACLCVCPAKNHILSSFLLITNRIQIYRCLHTQAGIKCGHTASLRSYGNISMIQRFEPLVLDVLCSSAQTDYSLLPLSMFINVDVSYLQTFSSRANLCDLLQSQLIILI